MEPLVNSSVSREVTVRAVSTVLRPWPTPLGLRAEQRPGTPWHTHTLSLSLSLYLSLSVSLSLYLPLSLSLSLSLSLYLSIYLSLSRLKKLWVARKQAGYYNDVRHEAWIETSEKAVRDPILLFPCMKSHREKIQQKYHAEQELINSTSFLSMSM